MPFAYAAVLNSHHTGCFVPIKGQACLYRIELILRGLFNGPAEQIKAF